MKGVPVTAYCDQARLDTQERLELFMQVCHAVQHAHQKGIIHRDLKPNNVLVALHDGKPVPKVIDFGIAKATEHRLTEKTLFTEFRQMVGTPDYMAPEQAELSGLDIDTRADVYSLGVLLYELLTGTKPFDLKTLMQRGYDEILRTIREVDPQRPSTRVSTMGEHLPAVAGQRRTPPRLLGRLLRGDLDWIVMKALEKDRSRRYETANALVLDLQRHLADQPVLAGPPSALYRARKYVKRHAVGVAAASVVALALVAGAATAFSGYVEASDQRDLARAASEEADREAADAERAHREESRLAALAAAKEAEARTEAARATAVLDLARGMLSSADPHEVKGANRTVRQLLEEFEFDLVGQLRGEPGVEAAIREWVGGIYADLGLPDKAERHLSRAREIRAGSSE